MRREESKKVGMRPLIAGLLFLSAGLGIVLAASVSAAYEVVQVKDGGTVTGRISLDGAVPKPKGYNLIIYPDPQYCGRISNGEGWRLLYDFTVDGTGGLKDAVVMLEGITAGKAFNLSVPHVEARDCRFTPPLTVVRDGHAIEVVNMDPVMHDIQAYETSTLLGARVLFNQPLPMNFHHRRGDLHARHDHQPGKSMLGPIYLSKGRRVFLMQCGFHPYMESWALAIDSPYYAITDGSGEFRIGDVPPGVYRLVVWHPQAGRPLERRVTVGPSGTATMNVSLKAPHGRRSGLEVMENPRFGAGVLGRPIDIIPLVERQQ